MNAIQKRVFFKLYTMYLHFYLKQMYFFLSAIWFSWSWSSCSN